MNITDTTWTHSQPNETENLFEGQYRNSMRLNKVHLYWCVLLKNQGNQIESFSLLWANYKMISTFYFKADHTVQKRIYKTVNPSRNYKLHILTGHAEIMLVQFTCLLDQFIIVFTNARSHSWSLLPSTRTKPVLVIHMQLSEHELNMDVCFSGLDELSTSFKLVNRFPRNVGTIFLSWILFRLRRLYCHPFGSIITLMLRFHAMLQDNQLSCLA